MDAFDNPDDGGPGRRYLTLLFTDLSESARLAANMETEHYAKLLARLRRVYHDVIPKHGGTIIQVVGDGLMASFGYPDSREDDGRRATEAALELHEQVRRLCLDVTVPAVRLTLHTGIHSGLVLLEEGDALSGPVRLFGNAVNIAARLSDTAEADEILVSSEALGAERHFFAIDQERPVTLRGMSAPIVINRVVGQASIATRYEARCVRGLTPFIGRDAEQQELMDTLRGVVAGRMRCLAVVAPAGVGKTRLCHEFLAGAPDLGVRVLQGYCESYLSAEPMQPFRQILRSLCGLSLGMPVAEAADAVARTLDEIDPALKQHRPALLRSLSLTDRSGLGIGADGVGDNAAPAIAAVLDAVATRQPLVVFIDDWQWADAASCQLLGAIKSRRPNSILILLATREVTFGDVTLSGAQFLHLRPFNANETELAITRLLPGKDKFAIAKIREESGGNALFVEELCHSRVADVPRQRSSGRAWLERLIQARIAGLPREHYAVLRAAAVIGNVVPASLLQRVTGREATDPVVTALADQDLIYPGEQPGTLRFKHGIARDVIYAAVGLADREALHKRAAEALREQAEEGGREQLLELLAYHFSACGQSVEAARYAEQAGDKAMAASALDRAQAHYEAALSHLDPAGSDTAHYRRWLQIAQRLALASVFDPSRERLKILLRAVDLATVRNDQAARAYCEYWVGYIYYALGESGAAISHLQRALAGAQASGDAPIATQIRATLGQACSASSDYGSAAALLDEAIAVKRAYRKAGRPAVGLAYSLACKASVLGDRGEFDAALGCFEHALEAVRGANHEVEGSVLCWRAGVLLWRGCWEEALGSARDAQAVAERVKSRYLYAMSTALGAYASWNIQTTAASLQELTDATTWLEDGERGLFVSLNRGWLCECLVDCGRWQAARGHAARAMLRLRKRDMIGGAMTYRAMARASAAGHNRKCADHYLALATDNANARASPHEAAKVALCAAAIDFARGRRSDALARLDTAEQAFSAMAMPWHLDEVRKLRETH